MKIFLNFALKITFSEAIIFLAKVTLKYPNNIFKGNIVK